ncbi:hypothetical protein GWI33_007014 [Rhynchophorus ferrugineus]|uniref:Uncharacterized protein n=1 Tax=Rhynchophorus ferrugineus TaxID=354439 RepID=A0A834IF00_RHYFE|nr:hypothetical protein GWI33_007014 [Rhynchophorus ferrugineus]
MMYPMVQRQRDQHHKQNPNRNRAGLLEQQPTVSVISRGQFQQHEVLEPLQEVTVVQPELPDTDEEEEQREPKRPLHRRFFTYVREAWTGVKSALDSELEDLETPPRYRPDSLESLCRATRFTQDEIKRIYRGFKAECPTGVVREDTFKMIYAQFFPQGANSSQYAHYVFNTLDQDHSGLISFEIQHIKDNIRHENEEIQPQMLQDIMKITLKRDEIYIVNHDHHLADIFFQS